MEIQFSDLVRLHVFLYVGLLGEGSAADDALKRFLSCVTGNHGFRLGRKAWTVSQLSGTRTGVSQILAVRPVNSPPDVLLKVKVFREDFVTVITLQLRTFPFQLLC